jgi:enoyl-CoA hydratase/carnithine racemase
MLRDDPSWNRNLRAVVMSGEGRAFCTGLDARGVALSGPSESLRRLLERPSPFGGEGGLGNLAQDVCYLWRRVRVIVVLLSRSLFGLWTFFHFSHAIA